MMKFIAPLALWFSVLPATAATERMTCNERQSSFSCLVCNCYHESRGEPREDMMAVAKTVLSRKESDSYPDTVCAVVYQPSQFSWTADSYSNNISASETDDIRALQTCRDVADQAINEGANGLLSFYNPRKVTPSWAKKMTPCGRADGGAHVFLVPRGARCPTHLGANRSAATSPRPQPRPTGGDKAR